MLAFNSAAWFRYWQLLCRQAVMVILSAGDVLAAGRHTAYAGSWPPRLQAMLRGQTESHRRPDRAAGPLAGVVL